MRRRGAVFFELASCVVCNGLMGASRRQDPLDILAHVQSDPLRYCAGTGAEYGA